jgi:hypothetical protein
MTSIAFVIACNPFALAMAIGLPEDCAEACWRKEDGSADDTRAPAPIADACFMNSLRLDDIVPLFLCGTTNNWELMKK